jgi:hypothetical protein
MTVINGARPVVTRRPHKPLLHSALGVFTPKPRVAEEQAREQGRAARWFSRYGRRLKETVVTTVVCGLPTVAAFEWHLIAGLVASGVALMIIDAVADPGVSPDEHAE